MTLLTELGVPFIKLGRRCLYDKLDLDTWLDDYKTRERGRASSPDGQVVGGLDIPVDTAAPPAELKRWAAGVSWSPGSQTAGVWIERDVPVFKWVVRAGAEVNQVRVDTFATGIVSGVT